MYKRILVCLENSPTDQVIVDHVRTLAKQLGSTLVLIHVADGWAARNIKHLDLQESEEMQVDRRYLESIATAFAQNGVNAEPLLATGDPADEIHAAAERERCDLIAMATHGHRLIGDIVHGSVANQVRHRVTMPVLLVRAPGAGSRETS